MQNTKIWNTATTNDHQTNSSNTQQMKTMKQKDAKIKMEEQQKKASHAANMGTTYSFLKTEIVKDNVSFGVQINPADFLNGL